MSRTLDEMRDAADRVRQTMAFVGTSLDVGEARERIAQLEGELSAPGFWDDPDHARGVSAEHGRLQKAVERLEAMRTEVDELDSLFEMAVEEPALAGDLDRQLASLEQTLDALEEDRLFTGHYDAGDATVTLVAGEGGTDAQDWADMLLRMYLRWCERRGFSVELADRTDGEEAGIKSAELIVRGDHAYGLFTCERGVHRLVRLSPFDSAHRRQTSFAQVIVAPVVSDAAEVEIDDKEIRLDTYRATGAGGQHVNKTDSAVRITHLPTGIVVQCQNERSQMQNKAVAMTMLRARLVALAEETREAELAAERGGPVNTGFGSQIRSYVLHPYQQVKDLRTRVETGNVQAVLDGDLDAFVRAELKRRAGDHAGAA